MGEEDELGEEDGFAGCEVLEAEGEVEGLSVELGLWLGGLCEGSEDAANRTPSRGVPPACVARPMMSAGARMATSANGANRLITGLPRDCWSRWCAVTRGTRDILLGRFCPASGRSKLAC